ncbi:hypothetical protein Taro_013220 [Colocasia esculenta]|uniref:ENT domain-containing protein n=1 Tax=Colocasia esculenta TaxID=4460 RepID=A0A843UBG7_COLES|nr:hypothetical protein [Colocasia esculenta]
MKFKKGKPVEVLRRQDQSCGSWFPARIISVDAQGYTVRFEHFWTAEGEQVVEKVHLVDVRPCPPIIVNERGWAVGDIVEVFDLHSWRVGKVAKVLRNNRFVVGLLESIQLKEFHSSIVRDLQSWLDGKWVRIEKGNEEKQISRCSRKLHSGVMVEHQESFNKEICHESPLKKICSVRHAKRKCGSQLKSSPSGDITGNVKKQKTTLGGGHLATGTLSKEVNVISFPKTKLTENSLHGTIKRNNVGPCAMDVRRECMSLYAMQQSSLPPRVIEENVECSVASCSGNVLPEYAPSNSLKSCRVDARCPFDDAESSYPLEPRGKYFHVAKEDKIAENVHMLELHAYKTTVKALYASGPLSWEQESLLTNLRLSLHISNEEHLLQVRNLLSA